MDNRAPDRPGSPFWLKALAAPLFLSTNGLIFLLAKSIANARERPVILQHSASICHEQFLVPRGQRRSCMASEQQVNPLERPWWRATGLKS